MAYDRQARAADKLAALGISPDPNISPYTQWRRLSESSRAAGVRALAQRQPSYRGGGRNVVRTSGRAARSRLARFREGQRTVARQGGRVMRATSGDYVRRQLRQLDPDQAVRVDLTARMPSGEYRNVSIDGAGLGAGEGATAARGVVPQITVAPPGQPASSRATMTVADLLDQLDEADGDIWAWADDQLDQDYF